MSEALKNLSINIWTDKEEIEKLFGGENRVKFFESPRTGLFCGLFIEILEPETESVLPDLPWIIKISPGSESDIWFRLREFASVGGKVVNIVNTKQVNLEL